MLENRFSVATIMSDFVATGFECSLFCESLSTPIYPSEHTREACLSNQSRGLCGRLVLLPVIVASFLQSKVASYTSSCREYGVLCSLNETRQGSSYPRVDATSSHRTRQRSSFLPWLCQELSDRTSRAVAWHKRDISWTLLIGRNAALVHARARLTVLNSCLQRINPSVVSISECISSRAREVNCRLLTLGHHAIPRSLQCRLAIQLPT